MDLQDVHRDAWIHVSFAATARSRCRRSARIHSIYGCSKGTSLDLNYSDPNIDGSAVFPWHTHGCRSGLEHTCHGETQLARTVSPREGIPRILLLHRLNHGSIKRFLRPCSLLCAVCGSPSHCESARWSKSCSDECGYISAGET